MELTLLKEMRVSVELLASEGVGVRGVLGESVSEEWRRIVPTGWSISGNSSS